MSFGDFSLASSGYRKSIKQAYDRFLNNHNLSLGKAIANNHNCPKTILRKLAKHNYIPIREAVAENPATPMDVLLALTKDTSTDVRTALFENPNLNNEIVFALLSSKESLIQYKIITYALKNNCKPLLLHFIGDPTWQEYLKSKSVI